MTGKVQVASQYCAARRCGGVAWLAKSRRHPFSLRRLTSIKASSERYEIDLADRGFVALRHDAVGSQAKQERRERLRE